jgi:hypothetical protein
MLIIHNKDIQSILKNILKTKGVGVSEILKILNKQSINKYEPKFGNLYLYLVNSLIMWTICAKGEYRLSKDRIADMVLLPRNNGPLAIVEVKRAKVFKDSDEVERFRNQIKNYIRLSLKKFNGIIPIIVVIGREKGSFDYNYLSRIMVLLKKEIDTFCAEELKIASCSHYLSYIIITDNGDCLEYFVAPSEPQLSSNESLALFFDPDSQRFDKILVSC